MPPPMPIPNKGTDNIVTILILGSDSIDQKYIQRTDVMVGLAINRTQGTVSMLAFPRDTYVYVPDDGEMMKVNSVMGAMAGKHGPGTGWGYLHKAMIYNFGLDFDYYARINFTGFQKVVDALGGLDITVDCAVQANKLKSPELDPQDPANWEVYTMNIGLHHFDPYTALWYVRTRGSTGDVDRGRREMETLRAIWQQTKRQGLITKIAELWPSVSALIETNLTLQDALSFVPMMLSMDVGGVQRIEVQEDVDVKRWLTSDIKTFVWIPQRDNWIRIIQNFLTPPTRNRLGKDPVSVDMAISPGMADYKPVVMDRLAWEGYKINLIDPTTLDERDSTRIIDYTGGALPGELETLRQIFRVPRTNIISQPDASASSNFRVELGRRYISSCLYRLPDVAPVSTATPKP